MSDLDKALRVLASQGVARVVAASLTDEQVAQLAKLYPPEPPARKLVPEILSER